MLHTLKGEFKEARARLEQALVLFGDLETRWQLGRTRYELGELAIACSEMAEAREQFARALKWFEELDAAPDAARTRLALEKLG